MSTQVSEKQLLLEIQPLIQNGDSEKVKEMLGQYRPEDIADIFWELEVDEAKFIIKVIEKERAVEVIRSLDAELQERFFKGYAAAEIAEDVVAYLDSDDSVDILNLLPFR